MGNGHIVSPSETPALSKFYAYVFYNWPELLWVCLRIAQRSILEGTEESNTGSPLLFPERTLNYYAMKHCLPINEKKGKCKRFFEGISTITRSTELPEIKCCFTKKFCEGNGNTMDLFHLSKNANRKQK